MSDTHQADPARRARLRWRGRRGLLENDLIVTRFLDQHEATLTDDEVDAFSVLMELPDNDLLDLLLSRNELKNELGDEINRLHVQALLSRLRAL